jgi:hypothetical protein
MIAPKPVTNRRLAMRRTEEKQVTGTGVRQTTGRTRRVFPRAVLGVTALILLAGCARPVSFDNCTFNPTQVSPNVPPEDYRIAVLAAPPLRKPSDPRIEIEVRPAVGEPEQIYLHLTRLDDDPRMVTRETGREVDYWHRYALTEDSFEDYRRYRALIDAPPGGAAEFEATAWLVQPPLIPAGAPVRELRVRTDDAVGYDAICRP